MQTFDTLEQLLEYLQVSPDELGQPAQEALQEMCRSLRCTKEQLSALAHALVVGLWLGDGHVGDYAIDHW